jgi:hypothetical protein
MSEPEKPPMTREEAERIRDEHALDLAHLADKVSMSSKRRAEMEEQQNRPPDAEAGRGTD